MLPKAPKPQIEEPNLNGYDSSSESESEPLPQAFKEQLKNAQKDQQSNKSSDSRQVDGVTIFCKICQDFICHSVTTCCEHTFCEMCLNQYILYIDQCPHCGCRIRHQRLSNNILLDNLIMDYVKKYEPNQIKSYEERAEHTKEFQKARKLPNIQAGMKVDVRDADYIWCKGRIYRTLNKYQDKKIKCMIVKYDKSNKKEQFPENSQRIAPEGFFTNRKDIPKYYKGKIILENEEENVIYTIPNCYQQQEGEQKQESDK